MEPALNADTVRSIWEPRSKDDQHLRACRYSGLGRQYTGYPDDCCCRPPEHIDGTLRLNETGGSVEA